MPPPSSNTHLPASQPAARQPPKSPDSVLAETEAQWLFTEEELLRTPSIQDGMSKEKETEVRAKGINFIRQVGVMLKLPELTLNTAAIFFQRFLMRQTLVDRPGQKALHHYVCSFLFFQFLLFSLFLPFLRFLLFFQLLPVFQFLPQSLPSFRDSLSYLPSCPSSPIPLQTLGATALFLATKVEESCRKMKDIVIACCRVAQKNPNLIVDEQSKDFWKWRDTILQNEDVLLEVLCFDLTIEAPHKQLYDMLKFYGVHHNKQLRNAAWAFVTDSNQTQLCLLSSSRTIAAAALYCAARQSNVAFPDNPRGQPWWEVQHVRLKDMLRACTYMAYNYEHAPGKAGGPPDGGQSIYVGLFGSGGSDSTSPQDGGACRVVDESWERTRLRSDFSQGITASTSPDGASADTRDTNTDANVSTVDDKNVDATQQTSIHDEQNDQGRKLTSPGNNGVGGKRLYDEERSRGGQATSDEDRDVKKRRVSPPPPTVQPSMTTKAEDKGDTEMGDVGGGDDVSEEGEVEE